MGKAKLVQEVVLRNNLETIPNIYDLKKIGAGHEGIVFKYGNRALKLLKYDIHTREYKGLMIFKKAIFFQQNLSLKRIENPIDIMLDVNGVYIGFVTNYLDDITSQEKIGTPRYKDTGQFTCGDLICAARELEEDFDNLTQNNVLAKDINRGSYIYTTDFIHLCDMDKYVIQNGGNLEQLNRINLQFVIAKFLYFEMLKSVDLSQSQKNHLSKWVRKQSHSYNYFDQLEEEVRYDYAMPLCDYAKEKVKILLP